MQTTPTTYRTNVLGQTTWRHIAPLSLYKLCWPISHHCPRANDVDDISHHCPCPNDGDRHCTTVLIQMTLTNISHHCPRTNNSHQHIAPLSSYKQRSPTYRTTVPVQTTLTNISQHCPRTNDAGWHRISVLVQTHHSVPCSWSRTRLCVFFFFGGGESEPVLQHLPQWSLWHLNFDFSGFLHIYFSRAKCEASHCFWFCRFCKCRGWCYFSVWTGCALREGDLSDTQRFGAMGYLYCTVPNYFFIIIIIIILILIIIISVSGAHVLECSKLQIILMCNYWPTSHNFWNIITTLRRLHEKIIRC